MKRLRKRQLWLGALAGGLLALAGCDDKVTKGPNLVYKGPMMETTNVLTLFSDSAKLQFKITAPLEQRFENGDVLYPKGVLVTAYAKDGKSVSTTLTAHYGKLEPNKNLYTMRGDVRVVNVVQQEKLFTEELFFDRGKQQIFTKPDMFVKVETRTERLTGTGLTANQTFSNYRIAHPTGVFALDQPTAP